MDSVRFRGKGMTGSKRATTKGFMSSNHVSLLQYAINATIHNCENWGVTIVVRIVDVSNFGHICARIP